METAYAQALWKMIVSGKEPKHAVGALREALEKHGRTTLLPKIGRAFARIATREMRKHTITLTVAGEHDTRKAKAAAAKVLAELGAEGEAFDVQVDASIIGGWRLEGRGHLVDASFKKMLLDMYNRATSGVSGN